MMVREPILQIVDLMKSVDLINFFVSFISLFGVEIEAGEKVSTPSLMLTGPRRSGKRYETLLSLIQLL